MSILYQDVILERIISDLSIEDILSLYQTGDATLQEVIRDIFSNQKFKVQKIREFYLDCLEHVIESNPQPIIDLITNYGYNEEFYFDIHKQLVRNLIHHHPIILQSFSKEELLDEMTLEELLEVSPVAQQEIDGLIPVFYQKVLAKQKQLFRKYLLMVSDDEFKKVMQPLASYDPECIQRKMDALEQMI